MLGHFMKSLFLFFSLVYLSLSAQRIEKRSPSEALVIGFYNLENLYDTLNDVWKNDEDYTPEGVNKWTGERYREKIRHLAHAIAAIGSEASPAGVSLLGMCEVENKAVVEDLVSEPVLRDRHYAIVHLEGPDARGVDPSFIYQPSCFKLKKAVSYPVKLGMDTTHKTRDILVISGWIGKDALAILVNHWPSRRGGELRSRESRNKAARVARRIADSITGAEPLCRVLIMGDLNDDPVNECVRNYIRTVSSPAKLKSGEYYNPMEKLYLQGIGTLAYKDSWNLFDQIMLNEVWFTAPEGWRFAAVRIHNKTWLRTDYGSFKGYPFRSYSGGIYTGGYSDHFASYIILHKNKR